MSEITTPTDFKWHSTTRRKPEPHTLVLGVWYRNIGHGPMLIAYVPEEGKPDDDCWYEFYGFGQSVMRFFPPNYWTYIPRSPGMEELDRITGRVNS